MFIKIFLPCGPRKVTGSPWMPGWVWRPLPSSPAREAQHWRRLPRSRREGLWRLLHPRTRPHCRTRLAASAQDFSLLDNRTGKLLDKNIIRILAWLSERGTGCGLFTCNHGVGTVTLAVPHLLEDPVLGQDQLQLGSSPLRCVAPIKLFTT